MITLEQSKQIALARVNVLPLNKLNRLRLSVERKHSQGWMTTRMKDFIVDAIEKRLGE